MALVVLALVALEQAGKVTLVVQVLSQAIFPKVAAAVVLLLLEAMEMLEEVGVATVVLELRHPYQAQALHMLVAAVEVRISLRLLLVMAVLVVVVLVVLMLAQQVAQVQVLQRLEQLTLAVAVVETE